MSLQYENQTGKTIKLDELLVLSEIVMHKQIKTSGLSYILHISKRKNTSDKIEYVTTKKQEKARQKEAILRYLDSVETINNAEARELLKLAEKDRSKVSRLFAELIEEQEILKTEDSKPNNVIYRRVSKA